MSDPMEFPRPVSNPHGVRPALFGCVFGPAPGEAGLRGDVLACAFGIDPSAARPQRLWAEGWGEAMHLCDWKGGRVDGEAMDDFVVFGAAAEDWLLRSGVRRLGDPMARAAAMAEAGMDFFANRYGVARGRYASIAWIARRPPGALDDSGLMAARGAQEQARVAKRLILASWEAAQLAIAAAEGPEADRRRL